MDIKEELDNILKLLEEENVLLKKGIAEPKTADRLFEISEQKRKILAKIAKLEAKDLNPFRDTIKKIEELNKRNSILLLNNIDILEETVKTLIPEEYVDVYSKNGKISQNRSIFGKKV
ncbi:MULTISPECIES: hypothetical protein [unclassified Desulfurobacterium]|uniref:hypothetical protein n=1 Tax=Desulfurobacterium sp. TC5-1 TaxID=1158318 RepID=UPI0003B6A353|nr:hypothetical protein [Desulfurobacterium sp. TC5-1]